MSGADQSVQNATAAVAPVRDAARAGDPDAALDGGASGQAEARGVRHWARAAIESAVRLRPPLPRVERLSRKSVLVLTATSAALVALAFAFGLQPGQTSTESGAQPVGPAQPGERVVKAPRDYSQVPRLGPVMPVDAGQPTLKAEQPTDLAKGGMPSVTEQNGLRPAAPPVGSVGGSDLEARQRRQAESDAARQSRLFAGEVVARNKTAADDVPESAGPGKSLVFSATQPPTAPPTVTDMRQAFLDRADRTSTTSAARLVSPSGPALLQAGSVIPAALITGLRSDLPGQITAQVTQNVYDSLTGQLLLVPQGARLLGEYDAAITAGQRRALLVWTRLILPDGRSLQLDRLPGADPAGQAGLEDRTDFHWGGVMRAAAISTLLALGTQSGNDNDEALVRALRQGGQDSVSRAGTQIVARALDVPPTLTIRPGYPVRVLVTRDLLFQNSDETR